MRRKFTVCPSNYIGASQNINNSSDVVYCPYCDAKIEDIEECETGKMWTNNGDHALVYLCPECENPIVPCSDGSYCTFEDVND